MSPRGKQAEVPETFTPEEARTVWLLKSVERRWDEAEADVREFLLRILPCIPTGAGWIKLPLPRPMTWLWERADSAVPPSMEFDCAEVHIDLYDGGARFMLRYRGAEFCLIPSSRAAVHYVANRFARVIAREKRAR